MTYQRERDEFIMKASKEGLTLPVIIKLLRYASTLQRLAVAQCNGDWPADNGERKTKECPACGSGFHPSSFKTSSEWWEMAGGVTAHDPTGHDKHRKRAKICPDCRTQELVRELLSTENCKHDSKSMFTVTCTCGITPVFNGDPRGAVLRLSTPSYPYSDNGANGSYGLYVPSRER